MRRFHLVRSVDETGISGTGVVAEGVQYGDGVIAMRWCSKWPASVCFYQGGVAAVEAVHGHNGLTSIEWLDPLADIAPPEEALQGVTPPA